MLNHEAIQVSQLIKKYKDSSTPAVNDISFTIKPGTIWGLLGPNGAGKTTVISILCGLLKKTSGDVSIYGLNYQENREEIKQLIGVVPQDIAIYPTLTAYENLKYIGNMYGLKGQELKERISHCLSTFELDHVSNKRIESFSGGMKRRINLIAGILNKPKILFLDEPTIGVDVQSRNIIIEYLNKLNSEGATIIYTSHLMEEAENLCSYISIIDHGKIISDGSPTELLRQHSSSNLEQLFLKLTGRKLRD